MSDNVVLPDGRPVESLKVVELKKELEMLGLDKNGLKKDLVKRLSEALSDSSRSNSVVDDKIAEMPSEDTEVDEESTSKIDERSIEEQHASVMGGSFESSDVVPPESRKSLIEGVKHLPETVQQTSTLSKSASPEGFELESEKSVSEIDARPATDLGVNNEKSTPSEKETTELSVPPKQSPEKPSSPKVRTSKIAKDPVQDSERLDSSDILDASIHIATSDHSTETSSLPPVRADVDVEKPEGVVLSQSNQAIVEIHEEEEDYGDEEDIAMDAHIHEKVEKTPNRSVPREIEASYKKRTIEPVLDTQSKKETRVIGVTVEDPVRVNPSIAAKCPASDLVYIRCLVRPFTQAGLKFMLEKHFGTTVELWLDRIKSSAMIRFVDQATASKCREGLDGCRWPSINPRILQCEFGSEALFSWLKEQGEAGDKQPPRYLIDPSSATETNGNASGSKWNRTTNRGSTGSLKGKRHRTLEDEADGSAEQSSKRMRESSKGSKRSDETLKNLDDLFKKTDATPMIYWLPLSDEAAAAQLKARREKYIAEKTRRPVSKRNAEERRRDNRSPFMGEFEGGNPPQLPASDVVPKEKRAREITPSPDGNRSRYPHERRRSPPPPPPRRPRLANRTPSPRVVGSRRPASPSPGSRYRRRSPPRR